MARYYVMSDSADDLMWEDHSLVAIRHEIARMIALSSENGDHRYFPLSVQVEAPRSPYRRHMRVIATYHLNGAIDRTSYFVRENGETPR